VRKFVIFLLTIYVLCISAAASPELIFEKQIDVGAAVDICANDRYAFVNINNIQINVYDISDSNNIRYLTNIQPSVNILQMGIIGNRLIIAHGSGSSYYCSHVDISSIGLNQQLAVKSICSSVGSCYFTIGDGYLFVSKAGESNVYVYTTLYADQGRFIKKTQLGSTNLGITISDGFGFISASDNTYKIYDLTAYAGESSLDTFYKTSVAKPGNVNRVIKHGNYIYMTTNTYPSSTNQLYAYKLGDTSVTQLWSVCLLGQYGSRLPYMYAKGEFLYVSAQDLRKICLYDIANPEEGCREIDSVELPSGSYYGHSFVLKDDKIIATDYANGLAVLSVKGKLSGKSSNIDMNICNSEGVDVYNLTTGTMQPKLLVDNYSANEINSKFITAAYNHDRLIKCSMKDVNIPACSTNKIYEGDSLAVDTTAGGTAGLAVAGSGAYTSGYEMADFVANDKYAFVHVKDDLGHLGCSEIHIYDISDPANITYVNKVYATFAPEYTQGWQLNEMTLFGDYLVFKMNVNAGMGYYGTGYLKLSDINPNVSVLPITVLRWTNGEATLKVSDKKIFVADPNGSNADLLNEFQIINGEISCTRQDVWTADDHTVNAFRSLITNPKNSYALKLNSAGTGYEVYKDVDPFNLGTPIATLAMPSTGFAIDEFEIFDNYIAAKTSGAATYDKNNGIHLYNLNNAANENGFIPESASKGYWDNSAGGRLQGMDSNGNLLAVMFQDGKKLDLLNFTTLESYSTIQPANITPYGGFPVFAGDKLVLGMCYGGINIYNSKTTECTEIKAMLWKNNMPVIAAREAKKYDTSTIAANIYVDPQNGNDYYNGTEETRPLKTINAAKAQVRKINKITDRNIYVNLKGGIYETDTAINFDYDDSGFGGHKVIYKSWDGNMPIISGGKRITGWTVHDAGKNIYKASAQGINARQLYVNGQRAVRARSAGGLSNVTVDADKGILCSNTEILSYAKPSELEFVFKGKWTSPRLHATGVAMEAGQLRIAMQQPLWNSAVTREPSTVRLSNPWYYENAYELLDTPDEFYLDTAADTVYYIPRSGEDISSCEAYLPQTETLVNVKGSDLFSPAQNIVFEGIGFKDTTWNEPTVAGLLDVQNNIGNITNVSAVYTSRVENIEFIKCDFSNLGGAGLIMENGILNCKISGNNFYDISSWGLNIGEYVPNPYDSRILNDSINIDNNYIHDVATEFRGAAAISIGFLSNTTIRNNEIYNVPYTGMSIGWGWGRGPSNTKNLVVKNNYIHEVMTQLYDGGAIYTNGGTSGTTANPNLIYQNYCKNQYAGTAVLYTDNGSCFWKIAENVVDTTESASSWSPKWGSAYYADISDIVYTGNYVSSNNGYYNRGTNVTFENTYMVNSGLWPDAAKSIMNSAGLEAEYKTLWQ